MSWLYDKLFGQQSRKESKLITTNALIPSIEYINLDVIIGEIRNIKTKGLLPAGCLFEIQRSKLSNKVYVYFMHKDIDSMRLNPLTFEWLLKQSPLLANYSSDGIIKGKNSEWIIEVVNHYDPDFNLISL